MKLERIERGLKNMAESLVLRQGTKVDRLVRDYQDLQVVSGALGVRAPFEPQDFAEAAERTGYLDEEEAEELLNRVRQISGE